MFHEVGGGAKIQKLSAWFMDNPLYVDLRSPYKIVCKEIRVLKKEIQGFFELKIYPSSQCTVHNMQLL